MFTGTFGRIKGTLSIGCGYVNAKTGFGGYAGKSPWVVVYQRELFIPMNAMVKSYGNGSEFASLWNKYCVGPPDDTAALSVKKPAKHKAPGPSSP